MDAITVEGVNAVSNTPIPPTSSSDSVLELSSSGSAFIVPTSGHSTTVDTPRSGRMVDLPPITTTTTAITPVSPPAPSSPPLPARSPLRPPSRSISSQSSASTTSQRQSEAISVTSSLNAVASSNSSRASTTSTFTLDSPETPLTPVDDSFDLLLSSQSQMLMRERHSSLPSINGLMEQVREEFGIEDDEENNTLPLRVKATYRNAGIDEHQPRALMPRPDTPPSSLDFDEGPSSSTEELPSLPPKQPRVASMLAAQEVDPSEASETASELERPQKLLSKREHALHELLSSERAYASDLALIREVHLPLALGQSIPLHSLPLTPPTSISGSSSSTSSGNSSRAVSTASSDSLTAGHPPMTAEDVKMIFSNVAELAVFADMFSEELEGALGRVVDGGQGDDRVGELFLRITPDLERPYKYYITRHPTALQHLQGLPQTSALTTYLAYTQSVASSVSHAWDLASLLIKPVQRLLKYPLLLGAILDETPDGHPDKENLRKARARIEEIARNVNEGRRRAEVVKDVLTSKTPKKPNAPVGVAASVNLSKVKSLRHGGITAATMRVTQLTEGAHGEAAQVEAMQNELKRIDVFAQQFAKNVVDWGKMMANLVLTLRTWAISFGNVIGLTGEQGSEAFDAFVELVSTGLMPLTADLEASINNRLLKDMAHLLMTMNQPLKLLASMNEQEPYHYHLLTMPVSQKNRPPASLLAASTNYLALRGQLAAELPTYLALMHQGFAIFVRRLADLQTRFWKDVKDRWAELWEMLRVEGELNGGWEDTCSIWCARWSDVDEVVKSLNIMQPVPVSQYTSQVQLQAGAPSPAAYSRGYPAQQQSMQQSIPDRSPESESYFAYPDFYMAVPSSMSPQTKKDRDSHYEKEHKERQKLQRKISKNKEKDDRPNVETVTSLFAALEPSHSPNLKKQNVSHAASAMNMLSSLNPALGGMAVYPAASFTSGKGSVYSVSAPMPLGSVPSNRDGREHRRSRGRGTSDVSIASAFTSSSGKATHHSGSASTHSGNSSSRRPSSQDSCHSRQLLDAKNPALNARRRTHGYGLADEYEEYMQVHGTSLPPPYHSSNYPYSPSPSQSQAIANERQKLNRMKSMPSPLHSPNSDVTSVMTITTSRSPGPNHWNSASGGGYTVDTNKVSYQPSFEEHWEEESLAHTVRARERDRGRENARLSGPRAITTPTQTAAPKAKSKERPTHGRNRSGSVKSITSFFTGSSDRDRSSVAPPPDPQPLTASQRDSWVAKPAKYICQVIHPCRPPALVQYYSFPFFTLREGDLFEVLQEAGHPSIHPKLPLYVDDGEDCLLLCRDGNGLVGWALASFLEPITING
ncbi:hypothetical protein D9619_001613 [Psilocybe cf. subviscida]|uniref:DH domain-containing protein n=1 Tax=Psilocybe cf. subviscida TaxID=2480587 RepID=A0A8H5BF73_9AGAR|nr:hypothetical protein D9619_001613 [Psilocybe cf. subviscida]